MKPAKKKRTPRQEAAEREREERRAIAQAVRDEESRDWARARAGLPAALEPTWIDRRGVRHKVPIKVGH